MGILIRFAHDGNEEAKQFAIDHLKRWFDNPAYERFAGSIMNGVCGINPEEFPNYFPRFLEVVKRNPENFVLDACIRESIRIVTPDKMRDHLESLSQEERELIQSVME